MMEKMSLTVTLNLKKPSISAGHFCNNNVFANLKLNPKFRDIQRESGNTTSKVKFWRGLSEKLLHILEKYQIEYFFSVHHKGQKTLFVSFLPFVSRDHYSLADWSDDSNGCVMSNSSPVWHVFQTQRTQFACKCEKFSVRQNRFVHKTPLNINMKWYRLQ